MFTYFTYLPWLDESVGTLRDLVSTFQSGFTRSNVNFMKSSYNWATLLPHTKLEHQNKRSIQIEKIGKNLTVVFFIFCKYDWKPSTSLEEGNH